MKKLPKVSLITPAYNEEEVIGKFIEAALKSNYPKKKLEIIIVDDGSTDNTAKIVSQYPVKLIKNKHKGISHAKNTAIKASKGDILVFMGSDEVIDRNFIEEIVKFYPNRKIGGSTGTKEALDKKSLLARMMYLRNKTYKPSSITVVRAIRKDILDEIGYFDSDYGCFDDQEITERVKKARYKLVKLPKAVWWHRDQPNLKELYRKYVWEGKSMGCIIKGGSINGFRRMLFPIFCSLVPVYILFLFLDFPFWILGLIGLFLFIIIELKRSIDMYLMFKWKISFLTPIFDILSMMFVLIGVSKGLFAETPKV